MGPLVPLLLVVLDPGHHPGSPGATSARGRSEYLFNEEMVEVLRRAFDPVPGIYVAATRRPGQARSLSARAQVANDLDADILLSVHHDSVPTWELETWDDGGTSRVHSTAGRGFSLHVRGDAPRSVRIAKGIARALVAAGFSPAAYHHTWLLAVDADLGVFDRRELAVLNWSKGPAVLLECGFIIHREEELEVQEPARRERFARAVVAGVAAAFAPRPVVAKALDVARDGGSEDDEATPEALVDAQGP